MSSRKQRRRERKLAERHMVEAWAAWSRGERTVALRESERAVEHLLELDAAGVPAELALLRPDDPRLEACEAALYALLAPVAARAEALVDRGDRVQADLVAHRRRCRAHGGRHGDSAALRLPAGAVLAGERGTAERGFPLQVLLHLDEPGTIPGGELRLVDLSHGRRHRQHRVPLLPGDLVVLRARERLREVGGVHGLQPVAWTVEVPAGSPFLLLRLSFDLVA